MDTVAVDRFDEALTKLINYYLDEYDMNNAEIVGVLEVIKYRYIGHCLEDADEIQDNDNN